MEQLKFVSKDDNIKVKYPQSNPGDLCGLSTFIAIWINVSGGNLAGYLDRSPQDGSMLVLWWCGMICSVMSVC